MNTIAAALDNELAPVAVARPRSSTQHETDETLLKRVGQGDRRAMQILYTRHSVRTFRSLMRLIHDEALAEDLTSDVFTKVWQDADRFEGRSQVSTWILAIARFMAISTLRRRRDDALDDSHVETVVDPSDDPEVYLQNQDRLTILRRCLGHLSRDHREIIDLAYYHEKSIKEIAGIVGVPCNTVKTRMFYARQRMSELLQQAGVDR